MDLIENSSGQVAVRHPWERARATLIVDLLRSVLDDVDSSPRAPTGAPARVLDVGSGDAYVARRCVAALGSIVEIDCLDTGYTPGIIAELDRVAPARVRHVTEASGAFDVVLACDVLEHVADDVGFTAELSRRLRPGGALVVTVPAQQSLFGPHDEALGHHRRYACRQLTGLLESQGLVVTGSGQWFASLYAVRRVQQSLTRHRHRPAGDEYLAWGLGERSAQVLARVLQGEARLERRAESRGFGIRGLSCWATARSVDPSGEDR